MYDPGRGARLNPDGKALFEYAVKHAAEMGTKAGSCRSDQQRTWYLGQSAKALEQAQSVNAFFSLRRKVDDKTLERLRDTQAAAERAAENMRIAREREHREKWINREFNGHLGNPALFRRSLDGEAWESSMGVTVPADDFTRALRFVLARRSKGWTANGETCPVGQYQISSVSEHGVVAGCHRVTWSEVERLASVVAV
jgi:hypothetical protein